MASLLGRYVPVSLALCAFALSSCGGKAKKNGSYGGAQFHVATSALDASDVASVTVTVQGTSISDQLTNSSQGWGGVIGQIPVGSQTFFIVAYDASSNEIFWNGSGGTAVTINEGATAVVDVLLQQFMAATPFSDTAPVITSVTASSSAVGPGDVVNLVVNATSPVGAILSYAWTDNGGALGSPALSTTSWTAPGIQQSYNISIVVSDPSGANVGVTLFIDDSTANQTGSANVNATFNAWPVVNSFTASAYRIDLSGTTNLLLSATSPSGDTLGYAWSDNGCGGSFNDNTSTPTYTAPSSPPAGYPTTATCDLEATITDGQGGSNTASLTIQIGPVQNSEGAPVFTASLQSQGTANPADVVTFSVTGTDPLGGSLMWSWGFTPADGTASLSGEMDTATASAINFTMGSNQVVYTITVTATNAAGATSESFTVIEANPTEDWTQLSPAQSPTARIGSGVSYDSQHQVTVLFGGQDSGNANLGDTWTFDGTNWTQQSPANSPSARYFSGMAFDSVHQQTVLFGGYIFGGGIQGDTWTWDGANWTAQAPAHSPPARYGPQMAFDSNAGNVVLFGGYSGVFLNDTWTWDGTDWTQQSPATSPPVRNAGSLVFDSARGVSLLFGGYANGSTLNDTWTWDGSNWTQLTPANSPAARVGFMMAYDSTTEQTRLFGGSNTFFMLSDTWRWNGVTWTQLSPSNSPPATGYAMMAFVPAQDETVMFGGNNNGPLNSDTWVLAP